LRDYRKVLKYQISRYPSSDSQVVPFGRTDRHEEVNSRLSKFYKSAPKNCYVTVLEERGVFVEGRCQMMRSYGTDGRWKYEHLALVE